MAEVKKRLFPLSCTTVDLGNKEVDEIESKTEEVTERGLVAEFRFVSETTSSWFNFSRKHPRITQLRSDGTSIKL